MKWVTAGAPLPLGSGTELEVTDLKATYTPDGADTRVTITACIQLRAEVLFVRGAQIWACTACGQPPPAELGADALWYLLQNHRYDRLCFPREEGVKDAPDTYPVFGWTKSAEGLLCGECTAAVQDFLASRRGGVK